jgi:uncharacterized membrane protein YphA (DoxX/SURF4 family)
MTLLRQTLGLFFVIFGVTKIIPVLGFGYGFAGTAWFVGTAMAYPFATFLVAAAIAIEIGLGLALLLPATNATMDNVHKYAAYGLAAFTALATVMFHVPLVGGETLTTELTAVLKNIVIIAGLYAVGKEII